MGKVAPFTENSSDYECWPQNGLACSLISTREKTTNRNVTLKPCLGFCGNMQLQQIAIIILPIFDSTVDKK